MKLNNKYIQSVVAAASGAAAMYVGVQNPADKNSPEVMLVRSNDFFNGYKAGVMWTIHERAAQQANRKLNANEQFTNDWSKYIKPK